MFFRKETNFDNKLSSFALGFSGSIEIHAFRYFLTTTIILKSVHLFPMIKLHGIIRTLSLIFG